MTISALDVDDMLARKDAEIERLRAALKAVVSDVLEYERINNLSPNPGRHYCWDSVARAVNLLDEQKPGNKT